MKYVSTPTYYRYNVGAGNPDGTDWSLQLQSETYYTKEEFNELIENMLLQYLTKKKDEFKPSYEGDEFNPEGEIIRFDEYLFPELEKIGFSKVNISAEVYIEPYWGVDYFKNQKLKDIFNDEK